MLERGAQVTTRGTQVLNAATGIIEANCFTTPTTICHYARWSKYAADVDEVKQLRSMQVRDARCAGLIVTLRAT